MVEEVIIKKGMSRGACGCDSSRGRGYSERVSDRIKRGGIERTSVGLGQLIIGFLEGILGSSNARAFLFLPRIISSIIFNTGRKSFFLN
jgi:hypothetical protein